MPSAYELLFKFASQGLGELDKGSASTKAIGDAARYSANELRGFDAMVKAATQSGLSYRQALKGISKQSASQAGIAKEMAREILGVAKAHDVAAQSAQRLSETVIRTQQRQAEQQSQQGIRALASIGLQQAGVALPFGARAGLLGSLPGGATGLAATAGVAAAALLAREIITLTNATANYGREITNLSTKTGLTIQESQLFGRAAQIAGVNVTSLVTQVRTLSKALAENSDEGRRAKEALKELGLDQSIAFQSPGKALETIFSRLSQVQNQFDKERIATTLFGRGGLESLPLASNFNRTLAQARDAAPTISDEDIHKANEYKRLTTLLGIEYDALKNKLGIALIPAVQVLTEKLGILLKTFQTIGPSRPEQLSKLQEQLRDAESAREQAFTFGTPAEATAASARARDLRSQIAAFQREDTSATRAKFTQSEQGFSQSESAKAIERIRQQSEGTGFEAQVAGLRRQLRQAQDAAKAAEDQLTPAGVVAFGAQTRRAQALQNQIKSLEQIKKLQESIFELEQRTALRGFGQFGAIEQQRRKLVEQLQTPKEPAILDPAATRARLLKAAGELSLQEVKTVANELAIKAAKEFLAQEERRPRETTEQIRAIRNVGGFAPGAARPIPELPLSVAAALGNIPTDQGPLPGMVPLTNQSLELQNRLTTEAQSGEQVRRVRLEEERSNTLREASKQQRLAELQLQPSSSAPFETRIAAEQKAIELAFQNRIRLAHQLENIELAAAAAETDKNKQLVLFAEIEGEVRKQTLDAEFDRITKIAELRKKIADESEQRARSLAGSFYDALHNPQGAGRGLTQFGRQQLDQIGKKVFENITQGTIQTGLKAVSAIIPGQGTPDKPTAIGRFVHGTDLATRPDIQATTLNTTATGANTLAEQSLTQSIVNLGTYFASITGGTFDTTGISGITPPSGSSTTTLGFPALGGFGGIATPPFLAPGITASGGSADPLSEWLKMTAPVADTGVQAATATSGISKSLSSFSGNAAIGAKNPIQTLFGSSVQTGPGTATTSDSLGAAGAIGASLALAGAAAGATAGIMQLAKGGAHNVLAGLGTTALSVAALTGPAAPFVAAAGVGLEAVAAILGDPRQKRETQIQKELNLAHFYNPVGINASSSTQGGFADVARGGFIRTSPFSPFPSIEEPYAVKPWAPFGDLSYRNNIFVPGRTGSEFGGTGAPYVNQTGIPGLGSGPAPTINVNINAMDGASFGEFLKRNPTQLADGMDRALNAHSAFVRNLRQQLG